MEAIYTNAYGSKLDHAVKKVKCQYTTIILATLVGLPFPMICAKIQPEASSILEEKIFKVFYHIWAWQQPWSMDCYHFSYLSFPCPWEAPNEIRATLAQRLQRRSRLKLSTFFSYKCMAPMQMHREQIDLGIKRSNVTVRPLF